MRGGREGLPYIKGLYAFFYFSSFSLLLIRWLLQLLLLLLLLQAQQQQQQQQRNLPAAPHEVSVHMQRDSYFPSCLRFLFL